MSGSNGLNGSHNGGQASSIPGDQSLSQLFQALKVAHDPRSRQQQRQEAFEYLELVKQQDEAPAQGFQLAADRSQSVEIRHFGLSLLEVAIRLRWHNYGSQETATVRGWVLDLAQGIDESDALFIRNKIAQLWVEIAKRSWALDWMNMDEILVELWNGSAVRKVLVLEVLETLSENSFGKEDTTTALRGQDLSKACVEIFTPESTLVQHFPGRDTTLDVRYGDEGWLVRISSFLGWCNQQDSSHHDVQLCTVKALETLKSVVPWAILAGIASANTVQSVCQSLLSQNLSIRLAAVESLYALYSRQHYSTEDVKVLVGPLYDSETIEVLEGLYKWSIVPADDIDTEKYLLCKKLSELMHSVGNYMVSKSHALPENADVPKFLSLLLQIVNNESLHVSIPILHLWTQLLRLSKIKGSDPIASMLEPLLNLCIERLIKYEVLPEDADVPAMTFLHEDLDTIPERHAFLSNYARFCKTIVENIVFKLPQPALQHILTRTDQVIQEARQSQSSLNVENYKKSSDSAIRLDAQVTVIEAALLGYTAWRADRYKRPNAQAFVPEQEAINTMLESYCQGLFSLRFAGPNLQQRIIVLVADLVLDPLKKTVPLITAAFRYLVDIKAELLQSRRTTNNSQYNDDAKELQRFISHQIQRFALKFSDHLMESFSDVESKLGQLCQMPQVDEEDRDRCVAALLMIVQRTTKISREEQAQRLDSYVASTMVKWTDPSFREQMQSFDGFCNLLHIQGIGQYFSDRKALQIEDWSTIALDEEGRALKARIDNAQHELPLRVTSTFFAVSLDKTEPGTQAYDAALSLWSKYMPDMLELLLQFIGLAHMYSEPSTWNSGSPEIKNIQARILRDRFWQVGISSGSRDDFYQRVEQSKSSLEGLASAIRGSLRLVRDKSYRLLATIALLGDPLYRIEGLAPVLARSVFENATALTTHQTGMIIDMMRPIIEQCPVDCRESFLAPVLIAMFESLDHKITAEWANIERSKAAASEDDDLQEEMKNESILRNLTYNCVTLVVRLLDPNDTTHTNQPLIREFVLLSPSVLKSLILFCTHTLQMHDNRCCSTITKVLRSIISSFTIPDSSLHAEVREFISTEVLKAAINSIHDPYFVDTQSDLAQLIASILKRYSSLTDTPRQTLLQLPGVDPTVVDQSVQRVCKDPSTRVQRAVVLKLLENLRGTTITEQGRLIRSIPAPIVGPRRPMKSALAEKYASADGMKDSMQDGDHLPTVAKKDHSPDLGGVADMFA